MFRLFASKQSARAFGRRMQSTAGKLDAEFQAPNPAKGKAFAENAEKIADHSKVGSATWKKVTFFLAVPAIVASGISVFGVEKEHAEHRKHLTALSDDQWPQDYLYQNIRRNDFFWGDGDKTLFWNQGVNRHVKN
ncbi:DEKNAAC101733 [Brettanomyces naardenensis]|uniref:Cytochrome c oxidase subunit 13, mitochondrial n=1 Tax=Brettanomyces naardenensis TaxID=13370 RepID=A0A448YIZ0_BRENA|nr:DEKNAAC101733 [Brettanomyces naardenensis]